MNGIKLKVFYRDGQNSDMIGAVETGNVKLEKHSTRIVCSNCRKENFTRVEKKVSRDGMIWASCCCCIGSCYLSLLVLCIDVFREFIHYCPSCNSIAGRYKPSPSQGVGCLLFLIAMGILLLYFSVFVYLLWLFRLCWKLIDGTIHKCV